jgi:hypothetical protein
MSDVRAAAERLLQDAEEIIDWTSADWLEAVPGLIGDINRVARFALEAVNDRARLLGEVEAASACADLLVRIVRPMYAGPSGDQGLNDPLYGECLRAIDRYKRSRVAAAAVAPGASAAGDGDGER